MLKEREWVMSGREQILDRKDTVQYTSRTRSDPQAMQIGEGRAEDQGGGIKEGASPACARLPTAAPIPPLPISRRPSHYLITPLRCMLVAHFLHYQSSNPPCSRTPLHYFYLGYTVPPNLIRQSCCEECTKESARVRQTELRRGTKRTWLKTASAFPIEPVNPLQPL